MGVCSCPSGTTRLCTKLVEVQPLFRPTKEDFSLIALMSRNESASIPRLEIVPGLGWKH
jgi:hypothetical protein